MARPKLERGQAVAESSAKKERPRRQTSGERDLLSVDGRDKNRVYRWVNDSHGGQRIVAKQNQGWRIETDNTLSVGENNVGDAAGEGSPKKIFAGTGQNNLPMFAYLMSIERELYEEDQQYKLDDIAEQEKAILYGDPEGADYAAERSVESKRARIR